MNVWPYTGVTDTDAKLDRIYTLTLYVLRTHLLHRNWREDLLREREAPCVQRDAASPDSLKVVLEFFLNEFSKFSESWQNPTRMHSSRLRTARGSSRPREGGSASVHAGIHPPSVGLVWAWSYPGCEPGDPSPPRSDPSTSPWVWAWRPPWRPAARHLTEMLSPGLMWPTPPPSPWTDGWKHYLPQTFGR